MKILNFISVVGLMVLGVSCGSKPESKIQGYYSLTERTNAIMIIDATSISCQPAINGVPGGVMTTGYLVKSIEGNKITIEVANPADVTDPQHPKGTTLIISLEPDGLNIESNLLLKGHWKRIGR